MSILFIDSIPQYPSYKCYDCGTQLHDQNTSRWMEYHEHEGSQFAVKLCIGCKRVSEMMLASARKNKKDELEATISRQDAIRYIKSADASREAWIPGLLENGDIHEDWK